MKYLAAFLIALCSPVAILAQADTGITLPPFVTPTPGENDPYTAFTSAPVTGTDTLCLVPITSGGTPTQPIGTDPAAPTVFLESDPDLATVPAGAVCFQVYSTDSSVTAVPFTTIGVQAIATPTDVQSSAEGSATAVSASDNGGTARSGSNLKVILPAVLCSVIVALLLVLVLVHFRMSRRMDGSGKDRRWRQRPDGWAQDQKNVQQIPLKPQGPLAEPTSTYAI